ncbi:hypothetical protein HPB47_015945, partial [Ixodes persulcatus]
GSAVRNYVPFIRLDGANGVGAVKIKTLLPHLGGLLKIETFNDGTQGRLNHMVASYLKELIDAAKISLDMAIVQTAYANGSSTSYITNVLKVPVKCVPTGVKHLHREAQKADIGIYFEANGHGTVLFSEKAQSVIQGVANDDSQYPEQQQAARKLLHTMDLINQGAPVKAGVWRVASPRTPSPAGGACTLGARCLAVRRGPARSMVSTGTQTSSDDSRLPLGDDLPCPTCCFGPSGPGCPIPDLCSSEEAWGAPQAVDLCRST